MSGWIAGSLGSCIRLFPMRNSRFPGSCRLSVARYRSPLLTHVRRTCTRTHKTRASTSIDRRQNLCVCAIKTMRDDDDNVNDDRISKMCVQLLCISVQLNYVWCSEQRDSTDFDTLDCCNCNFAFRHNILCGRLGANAQKISNLPLCRSLFCFVEILIRSCNFVLFITFTPDCTLLLFFLISECILFTFHNNSAYSIVS